MLESSKSSPKTQSFTSLHIWHRKNIENLWIWLQKIGALGNDWQSGFNVVSDTPYVECISYFVIIIDYFYLFQMECSFILCMAYVEFKYRASNSQ